MEERARALVKTLPHLWECRAMLLPESESGPGYPAALREAIRTALVCLCLKTDEQSRHERGGVPDYVQLGVPFESPLSVSQMLAKIQSFCSDPGGNEK